MINKKGFPFLKAPDGNALPKIPPINPANIPREEIWFKKVIYVLNLYIMLNISNDGENNAEEKIQAINKIIWFVEKWKDEISEMENPSDFKKENLRKNI